MSISKEPHLAETLESELKTFFFSILKKLFKKSKKKSERNLLKLFFHLDRFSFRFSRNFCKNLYLRKGQETNFYEKLFTHEGFTNFSKKSRLKLEYSRILRANGTGNGSNSGTKTDFLTRVGPFERKSKCASFQP